MQSAPDIAIDLENIPRLFDRVNKHLLSLSSRTHTEYERDAEYARKRNIIDSHYLIQVSHKEVDKINEKMKKARICARCGVHYRKHHNFGSHKCKRTIETDCGKLFTIRCDHTDNCYEYNNEHSSPDARVTIVPLIFYMCEFVDIVSKQVVHIDYKYRTIRTNPGNENETEDIVDTNQSLIYVTRDHPDDFAKFANHMLGAGG